MVQDEILKYANPTTFYNPSILLEKMEPMHFLTYIHPDDHETVSSNYYKTLQGELIPPYCYRLFSQDGTIVWKEVTGIRILWEERPAVLVFTTDVTERVLAEEAVRKSERQLLDIINFLPDATFAVEKTGKVIAWNHAIEELTGIRAADILGEGNYSYAVPFYQKRRPMLIDLALKNNSTLEVEYLMLNKIGNCLFAEKQLTKEKKVQYLLCKASVIYDHNENIIGAIESLRDISDLKRTENELKIRTKTLEEANTAMKVLLRQRDEDRYEIEDRFMINLKKLILPGLEKLKKSTLDEEQKNYVSILDNNLRSISSSFLYKMAICNMYFTPRESEIACLIKDGKRTKEIALILNISASTVHIYRNSIRSKLGLNNKKVNLQTYLVSLNN
ncbi:MAG: PAS domain S-box protein [Syntrophales bacterium]|nr:PAS domain S-box protein [Syntrophales bacterium]